MRSPAEVHADYLAALDGQKTVIHELTEWVGFDDGTIDAKVKALEDGLAGRRSILVDHAPPDCSCDRPDHGHRCRECSQLWPCRTYRNAAAGLEVPDGHA